VADRLGEPAWRAIADYADGFDLGLDSWPSAEAQVAALSDDIAYNNHDVDDGLGAGLFTVEDLLEVPLIGPILVATRRDHPDLDARMIRLEAVRRMIGAMVDDVLGETSQRAEGLGSANAVRALGRPLVAFSEAMHADLTELRAFLYARMYRHYRVNRTRSQARRILGDLFDLFLKEPEVMPGGWSARALAKADEAGKARVVCDYIAGMTDRYAIEEHRKLFSLEVWS